MKSMYPIQIQSGGLQSGAYILQPTISGQACHSVDWGPTIWGLPVWGPTLWGPTISSNRFRARHATQLCFKKDIKDHHREAEGQGGKNTLRAKRGEKQNMCGLQEKQHTICGFRQGSGRPETKKKIPHAKRGDRKTCFGLPQRWRAKKQEKQIPRAKRAKTN